MRRGSMITVPASVGLTGTQIEFVERGEYYELFTLDEGGSLLSFITGAADGGIVSQSNSSDDITGDIPNGHKIVEIAGGSTLKVRFDSGLCYTYSRSGNTYSKVLEETDVCRVTRSNSYKFEYKYYRTPGTGGKSIPLIGTNIVAVFDGYFVDSIVTVDDIGEERIVGYAGGYPVVLGISGLVLKRNGESIHIDDFGEVFFDINTVNDFNALMGGAGDGSSTITDFPTQHKQYMLSRINTGAIRWFGVGSVGHVLDSSLYHAWLNVKTQTSQKSISGGYYIKGGDFYLANGTKINQVSLTGQALIDFIYNNDMSKYVVVNGATPTNIVAGSVKGIFYSYVSDRFVDVDLTNL